MTLRAYCHVHVALTAHLRRAGERNYVSIQAGRRVVPTELGITLVKGYQLIDQELCLPQACASCTAKESSEAVFVYIKPEARGPFETCILSRLVA